MTKDYIDWIYEFKLNGTFIMYNDKRGKTFEGKWYITSYTELDEDNHSTTYHTIHCSIYNQTTQSIEQYVWDIDLVNGKRLKLSEYYGSEIWRYHLIRQ